jgi:hypothetical protein
VGHLEITQASQEDAEIILHLQIHAYLSEAEIYNDYSIPPLIQTLKEIKQEFSQHVFLIALEEGKIVGSVRAYLVSTQEQIVTISEQNGESNLLVLKTQIPHTQLSFQGDRTETKEDVNSKLDYYFNPFLTGMAMWQAWLDMYDEFAAISMRLSLIWFDLG